jgi:hypothetical protein
LQYQLPSVLIDGSEAKKELGFSPECQPVGLSIEGIPPGKAHWEYLFQDPSATRLTGRAGS